MSGYEYVGYKMSFRAGGFIDMLISSNRPVQSPDLKDYQQTLTSKNFKQELYGAVYNLLLYLDLISEPLQTDLEQISYLYCIAHIFCPVTKRKFL